jgi:flagellar biosynthesis anti-sigma factor FlgM
MRIDSNQEAQQALSNERTSSQPAASGNPIAASSSSALGEDQAQLSGFHSEVQALVAHLSGLPEASQEKVHALREAIVSGRYQTNPDQVAGALFANMVVKLAA